MVQYCFRLRWLAPKISQKQECLESPYKIVEQSDAILVNLETSCGTGMIVYIYTDIICMVTDGDLSLWAGGLGWYMWQSLWIGL